jgi:hypothetical protein
VRGAVPREVRILTGEARGRSAQGWSERSEPQQSRKMVKTDAR